MESDSDNFNRNMPPYILVFIWSLKDRKHC